MKIGKIGRVAWVIGWTGVVLLSGCRLIPEPQADPTRYYALSMGPEREEGLGKGTLRVGLRTVEVAPYLRKGVMVVRRGEYELSYQDYARWAEPLESSLTRALRMRLQGSPRVNWVAVPPFPLEQERDVDVAVTVTRCEGVDHGGGRAAARLTATIELMRAGEGNRVVARKSFSAPEAGWDGRDYAALAAALSAAASALASEVEAALSADVAGR